MKKNIEKKSGLLSCLGWSYAERMLSQLVSLVVSIILARLLTPDDYGIVAIVTVFITIGDALVNGGFGNALVQKKDSDELDFHSIWWISLSTSIILYLIMFFTAPFLANMYEAPVLVSVIRVMSIKFIFSALNSVQSAYVQKNMLFRFFFFSTIGATLLSAVIGIIMAIFGYGVWALIAQYLTSSVVSTIILFCSIRWKPKFIFSLERVKILWKFGAKVLGATLVYTIRDNIRTLIVGKRFSTDDLAYYNQGQKFPALLVIDVVDSLGKVLYPELSKKQDDLLQVKELMRKAIQLSSYALTPMLFGLFAVSDTFVKLILTDKWLPCIPFMQIMCLGYCTRSLSAIFQKGLLSLGKSSLNLIHEIITSLATILLLVIAVFVFNSIELIAWSYVIVSLLGITLYGYWSNRHLKYRYCEMLLDYLPSLILSVIMCVCVMLLGLLNMGNFVKLFLQILAGISVYIALSAALKLRSFSYLFSIVVNKIKIQIEQKK